VSELLEVRSSRGRWVLLATILGSGMAQLDATVVNVALPRIGSELHSGLTGLQWTVNAYTLTLSGLLLLGGALGDRLGRRPVFAAGVALFTVSSAACALAPDLAVLVGMRAVQGCGAALLTPGSLAILESSFVPADRAAAVGSWTGLTGVASAAGPVIGGVLVGVAPWGWRLVFLLNLPLAAVVLLCSRQIPGTRATAKSGRLDLAGAALAAGGLAGVVAGLTQGEASGWGAAPLASLAVGLGALSVFLWHEGHAADPLLPPALFRSRVFSVANGLTLVVYAALGGALFLLPVQLQRGSGLSPVVAGASLLPVTAIMLVLSPVMGRWATRHGPRLALGGGPVLAALGLALLVRVGTHASYFRDVLPAVAVFGLGLAVTVAPLTATVLAAAPIRLVGVASAVNADLARTGGLLAVAVLPALSGISVAAYASPVALSRGFHHAVLIAAGLCVAGGVIGAVGIRSGPEAGVRGSTTSREPTVTTPLTPPATGAAG